MRNLIPKFIEKKFRLEEFHGHFEAFCLFIDLSGFTTLTQSLMRKGNIGAEELSISLNAIFGPMVARVYAKKGFIPYFAGDSFTAIFPVQDSPTQEIYRILDTAQQLCDLFAREKLDHSNLEYYKIGVKVGISFGTVDWGIVGKSLHAFYFRGNPIDACARCQLLASNGEIIVDEPVNQLVPHTELFAERQPGYYTFTGLVSEGASYPTQSADPATYTISREVALRFLPKEVLDFSEVGEFRPVVSIFLSFSGLKTHQELNAFSEVVLNLIQDFRGYFKEIDFGDKGGVMLAFFGAPVSFENNVYRALEFMAAVRITLREKTISPNFKLRAGFTSGIAYAGIIGGKERCQYAAVGHTVNLAARLMYNAAWGEILVDEEIQKNKMFKFQFKGNIQYKGILQNIPTFRYIGRKTTVKAGFTGAMVARNTELNQLISFSKPLLEHNFAGITYVYGEAGIGKSRLCFEIRKTLSDQIRLNWHICQSDQVLRKPLNPFLYFLKNYFDQSLENTPEENQLNFENRYEEILSNANLLKNRRAPSHITEFKRTKTILAGLLGIPYSKGLWQQLDAKGRFENTLAAITNLFILESLEAPTVIELEDAHWFDDTSKLLVAHLIKNIVGYPVWILITSRYGDSTQHLRLVDQKLIESLQTPFLEIDLNIFSDLALRQFAQYKLNGPLSQEFLELLIRSTNGNPFYAEQILEYFQESNLLTLEDEMWTIKDKNVKLSTSINAILTARIDRLSNLVKETVKAAAVIGREFELPILSEVMKSQDEFLERNGDTKLLLREQVKTAEKGQIWRAMNELRYIFKHALLREAAYDMQLRTRLRQLHQSIGEAIEKVYDEQQIKERYPDLAFHFEQSGNNAKTVEYLEKAGNRAKRNFQNRQALLYYEKLLDYLETEDERVKTYIKMGSILELIGEWGESEKVSRKALSLSQTLGNRDLIARANNKLGKLLMLKGQYDEAKSYLTIAITFFEIIKDITGRIKAYGNMGDLYFRQGLYEEAKSYFLKSIELAKGDDKATISARIAANLGLTYMNQGDYEEAIRFQLKQLLVTEKAGDKAGLATIYTNLGIVYFEKGDYHKALRSYQKGYQLSEELGNKLLMAIAIGCSGSIYQLQGQFNLALESFEKDLKITEELGDKQGISIAHGLLGELYSVTGDLEKAFHHLKKNLEISRQLGYQKGTAKALNTLGDVYSQAEQPEKSISHYEEAAQVAKQINNKLILGYCYAEIGFPLIANGQIDRATEAHAQAKVIGDEIQNNNLSYIIELLQLRLFSVNGKFDQAETLLKQMQKVYTSKEETAELLFEAWRLKPHHKDRRKQGLKAMKVLVEEYPSLIYKRKLAEISQPKPM